MLPSGYTTLPSTPAHGQTVARSVSPAQIMLLDTRRYKFLCKHSFHFLGQICLVMELLDHKYLVFKTSPPPVSKVMLCVPWSLIPVRTGCG